MPNWTQSSRPSVDAERPEGRSSSSTNMATPRRLCQSRPGIARALPNAEIFLTLAVGWIVAYLADLKTAAAKLGIGDAIVDRLTG